MLEKRKLSTQECVETKDGGFPNKTKPLSLSMLDYSKSVEETNK